MKKVILFSLLAINIFTQQVFGEILSESSSTATQDLSTANTTNNIQKLYPSFADIVEPLMPAVVNIQTEYKKTQTIRSKSLPGDNLFQEYLFDFFEQQFNLPLDLDEHLINTGSGSGFIIDETGYVVTNHHVIANADEIRVKLFDKSEYPAKLIGSDSRTDLALLKIDVNKPLSYVKFGNSKDVRIGDWIIAIGNPFGLGGSVTTGIISSRERDIEIDTGNLIDSFFQTDASINKGNSGGPMFDLNGEVIGVNTAIISPSGTSVGIGFSIPSDTAKKIIEQLKTEGEVVRGSLDINIQEVTAEIAEALGLSCNEGVLVVQVNPGGAAENAGIKNLDVITSFAGQPVKNARKLRILVAETALNNDTKVGIIRGGKSLELTCKILKANPSAKKLTGEVLKLSNKEGAEANDTGNFEKNETIFSNLTPELIEKYKLSRDLKGIIVTKTVVSKNNELKVRDVVMEINQQPVENVEQFKKRLDEVKVGNKKGVILTIKRGNVKFYTVFPISNSEEKK